MMAENNHNPAHLSKKTTGLIPIYNINSQHTPKLYNEFWLRSDQWFLFTARQTTPPWHHVRQGRGTTSTIGNLLDHGKFANPAEQREFTLGIKKQIFSEGAKHHMERGIKGEPLTRARYAKEKDKYVLELGFCIPRWETRLGCSVDGIVIDYSTMAKICPQIENLSEKDRPQFVPHREYLISLVQQSEGIIEIKRPENMWHTLKTRYKNGIVNCNPRQLSEDVDIWENRFSGIFQNYFDQMTLGMAILRKPWCDFVVEDENGEFYIESVPYCHNYFIQRMLLPIRSYLDQHIDPYLRPGWRLDVPI